MPPKQTESNALKGTVMILVHFLTLTNPIMCFQGKWLYLECEFQVSKVFVSSI